jgi:hypothetical protein
MMKNGRRSKMVKEGYPDRNMQYGVTKEQI